MLPQTTIAYKCYVVIICRDQIKVVFLFLFFNEIKNCSFGDGQSTCFQCDLLKEQQKVLSLQQFNQL